MTTSEVKIRTPRCVVRACVRACTHASLGSIVSGTIQGILYTQCQHRENPGIVIGSINDKDQIIGAAVTLLERRLHCARGAQRVLPCKELKKWPVNCIYNL